MGDVTLAAVGDISFRGEPGEGVDARGVAYPFAAIQLWLSDADVRFGNMESVFFGQDFPAAELSPKALAGPDRHAPALKEAGFDVMNMAANHVLDCGTTGLQHTQAVLREQGIAVFGAGMTPDEARQPVILERNGLRLGFLGYQEDCNYTYGHIGAGPAYLREEDILADMRMLRPQVDVLILSLHADLEFMETPAVWRRDLSRRLAQAGADLILHTHPHVPQGVERVGRCLVAYSLGNCLFDAHTSAYMRNNGPHTGHSFVLRVQLSAAGAGAFERLPFVIAEPPAQRPVPMTGARLQEGLTYLEALDAMLADETLVLQNWRKRCLSMLGVFLKRVEGLTPEAFMERWSWVLAGVQENRSWTAELVRMAEERFQAEAESGKDFLTYRRPSWRYEEA